MICILFFVYIWKCHVQESSKSRIIIPSFLRNSGSAGTNKNPLPSMKLYASVSWYWTCFLSLNNPLGPLGLRRSSPPQTILRVVEKQQLSVGWNRPANLSLARRLKGHVSCSPKVFEVPNGRSVSSWKACINPFFSLAVGRFEWKLLILSCWADH